MQPQVRLAPVLKYTYTYRKKVYKNRLKRWNMAKNIRVHRHSHAVDGQHLMELVEEATARGRRTVQLGNGQLVDAGRLGNYLRRQTHPSYNKRPPVSSVRIKPPDAIYQSESVVMLIRSFLRGRWEGSIRTAEDLDLLREKESPVTLRFGLYTSAVELALEEDNIPLALREMRRAPAELTTLLRDLPSAALSMFCRFLVLILRTARAGRSEGEARQIFGAVRALVRFAMTYAVNPEGLALSATHPVVGIMRGLLAVGDDVVLPLALRGWVVSCSTFDQILDYPGCVSAFCDWLNLTDGAGAVDDLPPNLGVTMKDTVGRYEAKYGPTSERTIKAMWFHASYLATVDSARGLGRYRNEEALQINKEMLRRGVKGRAASSAHAYVAKVYAHRGEKILAEEHLWEAVNMYAELSGRRESPYVTCLKEWYTKWDEPEKLARLNLWCQEAEIVEEAR